MQKLRSALIFSFFALAGALLGAEGSRISIAIPDLKSLDAASAAEVGAVTELIVHEVSNIPIFDVLERKEATALYDEISYQLLTATEMDDAVLNSRIKGARALLLGSYGRLYGRILITTRLVDLQNGHILFANSIYTDEASIKASITELAGAIQEKGLELGLEVGAADIERQVKAKNWSEAKRLIDIHLRSKPADEELRSLFAQITAGLAEDHYREAQRYVRQGLFDEARLRIGEAIALTPDGRYYSYREQISRAEQDWIYRKKLEDARRAAALERGEAVAPFWRAVGSYFSALSVDGARLGLSLGLDGGLSASLAGSGDYGLDLSWNKAQSPAGGKALLSWDYYAGAALRYEAAGEAGKSVLLQLYASPLLAESFRLGNVALTLGADAGGLLWYGPVSPEGFLLGLSFGASACVDLKVSGRSGCFALGKADWRYWPEAPDKSGPALRVTAGLVL